MLEINCWLISAKVSSKTWLYEETNRYKLQHEIYLGRLACWSCRRVQADGTNLVPHCQLYWSLPFVYVSNARQTAACWNCLYAYCFVSMNFAITNLIRVYLIKYVPSFLSFFTPLGILNGKNGIQTVDPQGKIVNWFYFIFCNFLNKEYF